MNLHQMIKQGVAHMLANAGAMLLAGALAYKLALPAWAIIAAALAAVTALTWWQGWPPFRWAIPAQAVPERDSMPIT